MQVVVFRDTARDRKREGGQGEDLRHLCLDVNHGPADVPTAVTRRLEGAGAVGWRAGDPATDGRRQMGGTAHTAVGVLGTTNRENGFRWLKPNKSS